MGVFEEGTGIEYKRRNKIRKRRKWKEGWRHQPITVARQGWEVGSMQLCVSVAHKHMVTRLNYTGACGKIERSQHFLTRYLPISHGNTNVAKEKLKSLLPEFGMNFN